MKSLIPDQIKQALKWRKVFYLTLGGGSLDEESIDYLGELLDLDRVTAWYNYSVKGRTPDMTQAEDELVEIAWAKAQEEE